MNYEKIKKQNCLKIIQNKTRCVLSMCDGCNPYAVPMYYDSDIDCGCIKLYLKSCKCGQKMNYINCNNRVCILITNNCNCYIDSVILTGTIEIINEENQCYCKNMNSDYYTLEFIPSHISGRRYFKN